LILIDANILMYSFGKEHRYRQASVQILEDIARSALDGNIDTEALQEILYVYSERGERERGLQVFDALLRVFPRPLPVEREDMLAARILMGSYSWLRSRDAVHAGVAIRHNLEAIISADRAFDEVTEIKRLDPLELYP
jgi:predicted nucleic acid-binding protein